MTSVNIKTDIGQVFNFFNLFFLLLMLIMLLFDNGHIARC